MNYLFFASVAITCLAEANFLVAMQTPQESVTYNQEIKESAEIIASFREQRRSQKQLKNQLRKDAAYAATMENRCKDVVAFVKKYPTTTNTLENYIKHYTQNHYPDLTSSEYTFICRNTKEQLDVYFYRIASKQKEALMQPRKPLRLVPCTTCRAQLSSQNGETSLKMHSPIPQRIIAATRIIPDDALDQDNKLAILV